MITANPDIARTMKPSQTSVRVSDGGYWISTSPSSSKMSGVLGSVMDGGLLRRGRWKPRNVFSLDSVSDVMSRKQSPTYACQLNKPQAVTRLASRRLRVLYIFLVRVNNPMRWPIAAAATRYFIPTLSTALVLLAIHKTHAAWIVVSLGVVAVETSRSHRRRASASN